MAQSLVCKDCNIFLRSVKEAQDHADATGHTNFEESVEAVKRLVCQDSGKVCRNDTDQELHTKRTGLQDDDATATAGKGGSAATADVELVAAEVNEAVLQQMLDMGFGNNRAIRAIYNSGGESVDAAIAWVADHENDLGIDEPLMVPKATAKKILSPEEAKAQASELIRKAKEKREAEEKETERLREVERVRMGKEMAAMVRKEEELRLKRAAEERLREKLEEERAREKVKKKLEQDRMERRALHGLPLELTEEEKEEERRKERERAEAEAKRRLPVKPVAKAERMRVLLVEMKKAHSNEDEALKTAWKTLLKFVTNVAMNPTEGKYRKIRLTNPAVQERVVAFTGAVDFLEVCGFKKESGELEMPADAVDRMVLEAAAENLNSALTNPFFGAL